MHGDFWVLVPNQTASKGQQILDSKPDAQLIQAPNAFSVPQSRFFFPHPADEETE